MTLYEFNALDEMEQAEAVWEGVFIADREDDEHKILLYQIDGFYVEVYYHKEYNVVRRFRSFLPRSPRPLFGMPYYLGVKTNKFKSHIG